MSQSIMRRVFFVLTLFFKIHDGKQKGKKKLHRIL